MDHDLALALHLQAELDRESLVEVISSNSGPQNSKYTETSGKALSPVDPSWETLDPNPDIRALFLQFNERFFWGRLAGIEVKWSPRMTLCAGLCVYEGRGGLCSVRLSLPLLKLRPRKDLVETLLHEMIHAYLFVTDNNKDHDGHGPEFHKHMYRINNDIGSKISVYHTFHDEVAEYRQHWWRCNGPCQDRKPFYGYVKRAMNRAPSERDPWWKVHKQSCNGTFIKIKEPENYGKKKNKKEEKPEDAKKQENVKKPKDTVKKNMDIRFFVGKGNVLGEGSKDKAISKSITKDSRTDDEIVPSQNKAFAAGSSKTGESSNNKPSSTITPESDLLWKHKKEESQTKANKGSNSPTDLMIIDSEDELDNTIQADKDKKCENIGDVQTKLREVWAQRFSNSASGKGLSLLSTKKSVNSDNIKQHNKQGALQQSSTSSHVTSSSSKNTTLTASTVTGKHKTNSVPVIPSDRNEAKRAKTDSTLADMFKDVSYEKRHPCPVCNLSIKESLINEHLDRCLQ